MSVSRTKHVPLEAGFRSDLLPTLSPVLSTAPANADDVTYEPLQQWGLGEA